MAGRVKVHVWPRMDAGIRVQPVSCPASKDVTRGYPCCFNVTADGSILTCPFVYGTENDFDGNAQRHYNNEAAMADLTEWPENRNTFRVLCLRQPSEGTLPGAAG